MFKSASKTVTTTATALNQAEADNTGTSGLLVAVPSGGATIYVGGADVTAANGFPVAAGQTLTTDVDRGEQLYAVTASGTQAVAVLNGSV